MRINRFLSMAGLGSRRSTEELVRAGRITLNDRVVTELATLVDPETDQVRYDGRLVSPAPPGKILLFHKAKGVVCSFRRQGDAPCLADALPAELQKGRLFHVGRLDRESTGLLLLSDDGDLAQRLLHPSRPVWKRYRLELDGSLEQSDLDRIRRGDMLLDGRRCQPARIEALQRVHEYRMSLREGRNRQIRRMIEQLGQRVVMLEREAFGPVELGRLPVGHCRPATEQEEAALRECAGEAASEPGD